jgi:PAS domain S-box-containing protein
LVRFGLVLWVVTSILIIFERPHFITGVYWNSTTNFYLMDFGPLSWMLGVPSYFFLIYSVVKLCWGYRRATSRNERHRIGILLIGLSLVILGTLANFVTPLKPYPVDIAANVLNALLIGYAILRYQLLDISVVVRKGLMYTLPTAALGAAYFLMVYLAVNLFHAATGIRMLVVSLAMAAVAGVVARPLWDRFQRGVDRLFFREKYDEGVMLQRLSRTVASVLDVDDLTQMILDDIAATMYIVRAAFYLKREAGGEFRLAAQRGLAHINGQTMRRDHPLVGWLSRRGTALTRDEVEAAPQFKALWAREREQMDLIGAELFVPLLVRGELIGILILGPRRSELPYSPYEKLTLVMLANQTAVAVENARMFSHEQRKVRQSSALLEIAEAVGATLDLDHLLELMTQKTAEVCGVDRCTILLLDAQRRMLTPLMTQSRDRAEEPGSWHVFKNSSHTDTIDYTPLLKRMLEDRQPVIVDAESLEPIPASWIEPLGAKSLLAVPLVSKDVVIGLMALDHMESGRGFSDEQVGLATTIGSQVASAIENARLYEEVVKERDRSETILEEAFAGLMVIDPEMRIVSMNAGAAAMSGYAPEDVLHKRLPEVFGPDLWSEGSLLQRAMASGTRVDPAEAVLVGGDGPRDVLLGVAALRDGYLLSLADITYLKAVDRLRSDIIANVSHELRTPLASIKAYTELLLDDLENGGEGNSQFLSIIDRESDRLAGLINDLLDLSRLEQGKFDLQKEPLDIADVVSDVVCSLEVQLREGDITIEVDMPDDLPTVLANQPLMTTLVKNLLSNAIKFSPKGGQVSLVVQEGARTLELEVADQGIGISSEELPHLFEKFYRTEAARLSGISGTGLGLVLVKEAVKAHGGGIAVESEVGTGTRFSVSLPLNGQAPDADELSPEGQLAAMGAELAVRV